MHVTQERGMDGMCGNFNRCHCVSFNNLAQNLPLLCVTYAHVHVFVPGISWNIMEQNNINTVQDVAHAIDILAVRWVFSCTYASNRITQQPCHNLLHIIIYNIQP